MWTYCLGIHNLANNNVYWFVWNESIASQGSLEIASCLLYFLKHFVNTTKLMYSDQCGNRFEILNCLYYVNSQYIVSNPI